MQSAGPGGIESHRIRSIAANRGILRSVDNKGLGASEAGDRNCDRTGSGIDCSYQPSESARLPILAILFLMSLDVRPLHNHDRCGGDDLSIVRGFPRHQNPVADLQVLQLDRGRILQVFFSGRDAHETCGRLHRNVDFRTRIWRKSDDVAGDSLNGPHMSRCGTSPGSFLNLRLPDRPGQADWNQARANYSGHPEDENR